ncbi:alpha/beta fold hydrolase [Pusillimonas caeni]|uniref:alpha/beta fold hydrolase n=1 Tax=Pusillimonas caeni TaxID=1348472 RepID=UPI001430C659|nr:alpha/beta fold hydrolase [Pusillimonas caeni]
MRTLHIPSQPRLAATVCGSGPLVIMIHGLGGDRSIWRPQLQGLKDHFTAVSLDLRGYGESDPAPLPLDFKKDFCADVIATMDFFGAPRAHLVGLSMGGRVARTTALQAPRRVASLILANTSPGFDHLDDAQAEAFIRSRSSFATDERLPPEFGRRQAAAMMADTASRQALDAAARAMSTLRADHYLSVLRASTIQDRGDKLETIGCPTLIIASDQDTVYPQAVTQELLARIPHAASAVIANAGHISNLEQPQAFNEAILAFLKAQKNDSAYS